MKVEEQVASGRVTFFCNKSHYTFWNILQNTANKMNFILVRLLRVDIWQTLATSQRRIKQVTCHHSMDPTGHLKKLCYFRKVSMQSWNPSQLEKAKCIRNKPLSRQYWNYLNYHDFVFCCPMDMSVLTKQLEHTSCFQILVSAFACKNKFLLVHYRSWNYMLQNYINKIFLV